MPEGEMGLEYRVTCSVCSLHLSGEGVSGWLELPDAVAWIAAHRHHPYVYYHVTPEEAAEAEYYLKPRVKGGVSWELWGRM